MTRFERYNEIMFEAYCKKAIDNATRKERKKKANRGKLELPYSALTDDALYALSAEDNRIDDIDIAEDCRIFQVQGEKIPVYSEKLGQALSFLMPRDREIILLYFFVGAKTNAIAHRLKISPSTVRRRRKCALQKLGDFLETSK